MSKLLTPNYTYEANGVTVNEKIIPDGTRWKDDAKARANGFKAGDLYKGNKLICGTGKPTYITVHNTNDLANVYDDGEQYTRATYNENMNTSRVHFYADDVCAWQDLKVGSGMTPNDPKGSAEVGWHAGDGTVKTGGNETSLSIEIIMNDNAEHDAKAKENGARLVAWLMKLHNIPIERVVTHTYWVNKSAGKTFADPDVQSTNYVKGKKWCPQYILGNTSSALANWKAFKQMILKYSEEDMNDDVKKEITNLTKTISELGNTVEDLKKGLAAATETIQELNKAVATHAKQLKVYHYWSEIKAINKPKDKDYGWAYLPLKAMYDAGLFSGSSASDLNVTMSEIRTLCWIAAALRKQGVIKY